MLSAVHVYSVVTMVIEPIMAHIHVINTMNL